MKNKNPQNPKQQNTIHPPLHSHPLVLHVLRPDLYPDRDTSEFPVVELVPRFELPVVHVHADAGGFHFLLGFLDDGNWEEN